MKEKFFIITEDTPPDHETDEGKWWLCCKGKKYDIWRFDSKKKDFKTYLLLRRADNKIVDDAVTIEEIGIKQDLFDNYD